MLSSSRGHQMRAAFGENPGVTVNYMADTRGSKTFSMVGHVGVVEQRQWAAIGPNVSQYVYHSAKTSRMHLLWIFSQEHHSKSVMRTYLMQYVELLSETTKKMSHDA